VDWNSLDAIRALPKVELHAHLGGCIPTSAVKNLLREFQIRVPGGDDLERGLSIVEPVASLAEYLKSRRALDLLPRGKACLEQMFRSALAALALDGVVYAELRHSPFKLARLNNLSFRTALEWAVEALDAAKTAVRGIEPRLILGIDRANVKIANVEQVLNAYALLDRPKQIVGLDVSGDESFPITDELAGVLREAAAGLGLGVTIHAGESGPPEHIRFAVEHCGATRIGHGLAAAQSPPLLELLKRRGICLEVCLRSNILTSAVPSLEEHPIFTFIEHDVPFVLCTDNPGVHAFSLSQEYLLFHSLTGREDILGSMFARQSRYAFNLPI
jgi:adenosine deaminase